MTQQFHSWVYIWKKNPNKPETLIQKDTGTSMFIAALFTIAKVWEQPKCPSTDEWIKKMWYIYTTEYYSAIKKNEILPFAATWLDLEGITLSEISQTEKDKYCMISYVEPKKYNKLVNITKKKQTYRYREQTSGYQWGEGKGVGQYRSRGF